MISALSSVSSLAFAGLSFIQINPKQRGRTLKCRRTAWRSELSRIVDVYLPPGRGSAQEGRALRTTVLPCLVVQYAPHESRDEFEGTSFARGRGLAHVVPGFFFGDCILDKPNRDSYLIINKMGLSDVRIIQAVFPRRESSL